MHFNCFPEAGKITIHGLMVPYRFYSFNYVVVEFFLSGLLLVSNASEPVSII